MCLQLPITYPISIRSKRNFGRNSQIVLTIGAFNVHAAGVTLGIVYNGAEAQKTMMMSVSNGQNILTVLCVPLDTEPERDAPRNRRTEMVK